MEIEEVAKEHPEEIKTFEIDFAHGVTPDLATKIASFLKLTPGAQTKQAVDQLQKLYALFLKIDASQIEINPWAVTPDGDLYCVDAKIQIDENAHY